METAVNTETKTVAEYLALYGNSEHVDISHVNRDILNIQCQRAAWVTVSRGLLQAHCGGLCIAAFVPVKSTLRTIYLVVDDDAGRSWHAELAARVLKGDTSLRGSCPSPVLRLVQSA